MEVLGQFLQAGVGAFFGMVQFYIPIGGYAILIIMKKPTGNFHKLFLLSSAFFLAAGAPIMTGFLSMIPKQENAGSVGTLMYFLAAACIFRFFQFHWKRFWDIDPTKTGLHLEEGRLWKWFREWFFADNKKIRPEAQELCINIAQLICLCGFAKSQLELGNLFFGWALILCASWGYGVMVIYQAFLSRMNLMDYFTAQITQTAFQQWRDQTIKTHVERMKEAGEEALELPQPTGNRRKERFSEVQ